MKLKIFILLLMIAVCTPLSSFAQGIDVARAAAIELASKKAKKTLEAEIKAQGLMTAGHEWTKEEIKATTEFQREFNDYLDQMHDAISIAAEIYGIYHEVKKTSKNIRNVSDVLAHSPTNALAVAFSTRRNVVYRNIVQNSLDIIMDIRKVCFEEAKMTEQERNKILRSIRPKLRKFNRQLEALGLALRYTSMIDVWNEITGRAYRINHTTKKDIIARCRKDWWDTARAIH